jgi:protein-L-isoaspartate(D-aspartate) O-methyltransferase
MQRRSDYRIKRDRMVRFLEQTRGVRDQRVLQAMREVPRHLFVRKHLWSQAYGDHALPIGEGQTISQPYVVARMSEILEIDSEHSVLEIGTGTGYQTAILAKLARRVYSLERIPELARKAIERMRELGFENVKIQAFDGTIGWSDVAPFDRIMITAGAPHPPKALLEQLAVGGRLLVPEGGRDTQRLVLYAKDQEGRVRSQKGEYVVFVPLIGRDGWEEDTR